MDLQVGSNYYVDVRLQMKKWPYACKTLDIIMVKKVGPKNNFRLSNHKRT